MAFIYDLTDTWNASGTTFNAIKMNVTDTASAAASKLVTLQVGGSERFGVDKTGVASFAGAIRGPLGSASAPAFSFTGDTNTGMWSPAADTIAFSEGGAEVMRITSAGNFGFGTSAPTERVTVAGRVRSSVSGQIIDVWHDGTNGSLASSTQLLLYANGANNMIFHTDGVRRMRITSAGNVAIGTDSPNAAALLDVSSTTQGFLPPRMTTAQRDAITSPPDGLMLYNTTTNKLQVRAASAWVDLH